jgi:hypothetical protein
MEVQAVVKVLNSFSFVAFFAPLDERLQKAMFGGLAL